MTGSIFSIQSFSVSDGPGIRTAVFFKGCPLRCVWCHNPESWERGAKLQFLAEKCIGCGACFAACPQGVHISDTDGLHHISRAACVACGQCATTCYAGALLLVGRTMEAREVLEVVERDRLYYEASGGGVTFSGGECTAQPAFLREVMGLCRRAGIHTAVDTAGCCPWEDIEALLEDTDLFLYDIKAHDPALHRKLTGADNALILTNLERLLNHGARVIVRIPCVPEGNWDDLPQVAAWLSGRPVEGVELLPYHPLGEGKFACIGREAVRFTEPDAAAMDGLVKIFEQVGVHASYAHDTTE